MADEPNDAQLQDTPADGVNDGGDGGSQDTYFLEVDDRTRYKTAEEAANGYREAGQRIAELTPWQSVAQEYGLTDPNEVSALLDELAELRAQAQSRSNGRGDGAPTNAQPSAPGPKTNLDPNSPEGKEAAAVEWLQKNGVKAGLVDQATLNAIQERLESLSQESERVAEERFEQRVDQGRNIMTQELQKAGFYPKDSSDTKAVEAGDRLSSMLEQAITTWINASPQRIAMFNNGGPGLANLVKQGLQEFLPTLNVLKNSSGAQRSATNVNRQGTRVAPTNTRAAAPNAKSPRNTGILKPEDGITPEVHEAAWAAFEAAQKGA